MEQQPISVDNLSQHPLHIQAIVNGCVGLENVVSVARTETCFVINIKAYASIFQEVLQMLGNNPSVVRIVPAAFGDVGHPYLQIIVKLT